MMTNLYHSNSGKNYKFKKDCKSSVSFVFETFFIFCAFNDVESLLFHGQLKKI